MPARELIAARDAYALPRDLFFENSEMPINWYFRIENAALRCNKLPCLINAQYLAALQPHPILSFCRHQRHPVVGSLSSQFVAQFIRRSASGAQAASQCAVAQSDLTDTPPHSRSLVRPPTPCSPSRHARTTPLRSARLSKLLTSDGGRKNRFDAGFVLRSLVNANAGTSATSNVARRVRCRA